jgi:Txe/YoeB family toxin of Txe-Axe toxin-antitoxin module
MSKEVEIKTHETMEKRVVVYGNKTLAMAEMNMKRLGRSEWKILGHIFGPVVEQGMWRIRINQELRELYKVVDIAADVIKKKKWNALDI